MPEGELRDRVEDRASRSASPGHEDDAGAVTRADDDVLGSGRAVEEVPRAERALLALDEQQALAGENEEVLLGLLFVVEAVRLTRLEHGQTDS